METVRKNEAEMLKRKMHSKRDEEQFRQAHQQTTQAKETLSAFENRATEVIQIKTERKKKTRVEEKNQKRASESRGIISNSLTHTSLQSPEAEERVGSRGNFCRKMAEDFSRSMTDTKPWIREAQRMYSRINVPKWLWTKGGPHTKHDELRGGLRGDLQTQRPEVTTEDGLKRNLPQSESRQTVTP